MKANDNVQVGGSVWRLEEWRRRGESPWRVATLSSSVDNQSRRFNVLSFNINILLSSRQTYILIYIRIPYVIIVK